MVAQRKPACSWSLTNSLVWGPEIALPESRQQKDIGTREICPIIDPAFAQGLPEDEWIIDNVDWLTGLFFENGVPLETAIIATLNLP